MSQPPLWDWPLDAFHATAALNRDGKHLVVIAFSA